MEEELFLSHVCDAGEKGSTQLIAFPLGKLWRQETKIIDLQVFLLETLIPSSIQ